MKMNSSWAGNSESDIVMLVNMGLVYENMIRVHLKLDIENDKKKSNNTKNEQGKYSLYISS